MHWVKHIAKNKGAPHLRSAAVDLPYYIYYNLDIYFGLFAVVCLFVAVAKKLIDASKNNTTKIKRKIQ